MTSPYVREPQIATSRASKSGDPIKLLEQLQDYIVKLQNTKDALPRRHPSRRFYDKFSFEFQQSRDLPPSIRAIVEDNRMLRGLLKQWKSRCHVAETVANTERTRCEQCREELATLRKNVSKEDLAEARNFHEMQKRVEDLEKKLESRDGAVAVLQKKQLVDSRLHQAELNEQAKQKDALSGQVSHLKAEVEALERAKRSEAIEARRVITKFSNYKKKAAEWKRQLGELLEKVESIHIENSAEKQTADKCTSTESVIEEKVFVMLCVITEMIEDTRPPCVEEIAAPKDK